MGRRSAWPNGHGKCGPSTLSASISDVQLLDYRDRHLAEAPADGMREALVRRIRAHRPHVVISFDPDAMNDHPDHVAIARFTIDAIAAAADPRWMDGVGRPYRVPRLLWTTPVLPWEVTRPRDLGREPGVDFVIDVAAQRAAKAAALPYSSDSIASRRRYMPDDGLSFGNSLPSPACLAVKARAR